MPNPTASMLVIGDELLSGRTEDANIPYLARALSVAGIDLCEVRIVGDREAAIVAAVRALSQNYDHLFTCGGIGPTHDDITADCVARALGVPVGVRDDARAILEAHYADRDVTLNEARLRMARIPDGATLIANEVSGAPGFSMSGIHVMAGVPSIFRAMVADLIPRLEGGRAMVQESFTIEGGEGDIADALRTVQEDYPSLSIGSYPAAGRIEVVVRGPEPEPVAEALCEIRRRVVA